VNHRAGKNLIGVFHQPSAVLIDLDFLETLSGRDYRAGLGESIKHAAVRDADFLRWQEDQPDAILARVPETVAELIAWNCRIKADVVARDEREDDLRAILNYGHTIGHAVEHELDFALRHGECVGLGMLAANALACTRGLLGSADAKRIGRLIGRVGLPLRLPRRVHPDRIAAICQADKKVRGGAVNFVLLSAPGRPVRVADVTSAEIVAAVEVLQP
jgi:3-dehydroquinate synthase